MSSRRRPAELRSDQIRVERDMFSRSHHLDEREIVVLGEVTSLVEEYSRLIREAVQKEFTKEMVVSTTHFLALPLGCDIMAVM